jgi:RimJ/RimL family protein N-acetyltransferase
MAADHPGRADPVPFLPVDDLRPDDAVWPAMRWPVDPTAELVGATVRLTPVDPDRDAAALFAALDRDEVWRHVPRRPPTPERYAAAMAEAAGDPTRQQWLVRGRRPVGGLAAGSVLGTTSYLDAAVPDARLEIGATMYVPSVWGTAVNPDAKLALLTLAFDGLGVGRVQLKTDVRNLRSQRAIARLGARYEGTLRRYQRRDDGTVRDSVLFSITAEDWPGVRERLVARLEGAGRLAGNVLRPGAGDAAGA